VDSRLNPNDSKNRKKNPKKQYVVFDLNDPQLASRYSYARSMRLKSKTWSFAQKTGHTLPPGVDLSRRAQLTFHDSS
jgi:hypothetical protein